MQATTLRRTRPGRSGGLRSARRALWESIHAARGVLAQAEEPAIILQASTVLCASIHEYAAIVRAIETHEDKI